MVEAIRKWRHYLARHFTLLTDQKFVSFMFGKNCKGKITNDKIVHWRIELCSYSFDISYRPGKENVLANTLSRVYCSVMSYGNLLDLYSSLCHPGVITFPFYPF